MNPPDALLRPDDDQLSAWLDGELPPADAARVAAWLHAHPDDAARVRLWATDRDHLRCLMDADLAEPVPPVWVQRLQQAEPVTAWPLRAAWGGLAAALMLASGLAGAWLERQGGWGAPQAAAPVAPWLQRAAAAHAVYVPEQRHPVEVSVHEGDATAQQAQEQHLARWLTKRLDLPVRLFDLRPQGYELVGGRLLPDAGQPGAQLMYQDGRGQRVTVYLRRPDAATPAAFRYEQVDGLGLFYWVDSTAGYALVGSLPRAQLLALAEALYAQGAGVPPAASGAVAQ